jgi:hypothetical protein
VRLSNGDKALTPVVGGEAESSAESFLTHLKAAQGKLAALTQYMHVGPELGNAITFDLGVPVPIDSIALRNRVGSPEVESRLVGCAVQVLGADERVVFEQRITFPAAEYQFEVR